MLGETSFRAEIVVEKNIVIDIIRALAAKNKFEFFIRIGFMFQDTKWCFYVLKYGKIVVEFK